MVTFHSNVLRRRMKTSVFIIAEWLVSIYDHGTQFCHIRYIFYKVIKCSIYPSFTLTFVIHERPIYSSFKFNIPRTHHIVNQPVKGMQSAEYSSTDNDLSLSNPIYFKFVMSSTFLSVSGNSCRKMLCKDS